MGDSEVSFNRGTPLNILTEGKVKNMTDDFTIYLAGGLLGTAILVGILAYMATQNKPTASPEETSLGAAPGTWVTEPALQIFSNPVKWGQLLSGTF